MTLTLKSLLILVAFSLTCISCSHSSVRTSESDLSDEAVAEQAASDVGEEVNEPVALMSEGETSSDSELAEEKAPAQEPVDVAQADLSSGDNGGDTGSTSSVTQDTAFSANTEASNDTLYAADPSDTATIDSIDTGAATATAPVLEKKAFRSKPRQANKHKNWQKIEKKPHANLVAPSEEERVVQSEIEKAMGDAGPVTDLAAARGLDEVPAVDIDEEKKDDAKLASVEISSFAQRHGWLVAFGAAGLIIFLFFTLTRNRAKKDMSL